MKRLIMLTVLLGLALTAAVEGSGHNAKYLPGSLAGLLSDGKFAQAGKLWTADGDLLVSSTFARYVGPDAIAHALAERYGAKAQITLVAFQSWPAEQEEGTPNDSQIVPGIQFINWGYRVQKERTTHIELFTAIAERTHLHPPYGPVDTKHEYQYRFLTVRLLTRPSPH